MSVQRGLPHKCAGSHKSVTSHMKYIYSSAKDMIKKRNIYELDDKNAKLPWLQDVRVAANGDEIVLMEAPSVPMVSIGRAFAHHLRLLGIVSLVELSSPVVSEPSHFCKLMLELNFGNYEIRLALELCYRYKDSAEFHAVSDLSETELCDWLFDRVFYDRNHSVMTEMKINYLLELISVRCTVNDLEVVV